MTFSPRTCAVNADVPALSLGYTQPGCQATGQPHRRSCIDREAYHWMPTARWTASLERPSWNDKWLSCALSGLSADSRSFVEGFMDPRCMLGYSHAQATAHAFNCSRDDACLSIYLNNAVAERVAYKHKQPGRWLCARTRDKPAGSQRHRKPHLHAPGMLRHTEQVDLD